MSLSRWQRLQNPLAAVFQKLDDVVEASLPAVAGIRHAEVVVAADVAEADEQNPIGTGRGGGQLPKGSSSATRAVSPAIRSRAASR